VGLDRTRITHHHAGAVKETFGQQLVEAFAPDFAEACAELDVKGGLHHLDRQRAKTGTGY
jgi:glutamate decarboxylase